MVVLLLLACSSNGGTDEALADFLTAVDAIDTLVAGHAAAVDAAGTVADVTTLEATYTTDWATQRSTLADALDMISQCAMADDDDAAMTEAMGTMDAIDAAVAAHGSEHAAHTDVAECQAAEADHGTTMSTMTATLRADHTTWSDSIECAMKEMSM